MNPGSVKNIHYKHPLLLSVFLKDILHVFLHLILCSVHKLYDEVALVQQKVMLDGAGKMQESHTFKLLMHSRCHSLVVVSFIIIRHRGQDKMVDVLHVTWFSNMTTVLVFSQIPLKFVSKILGATSSYFGSCTHSNYAILTHWGRVSKLTIIGSDNGLSPGRRQANIWTNDRILLIGTSGTNFSEIFNEIHTLSLKKIGLKMSAKCCSSLLGPNVLITNRSLAMSALSSSSSPSSSWLA